MLIKKEIKSKSQLLIIGSLLLLIGLSILSFKVINYHKNIELEKNIITEFYEEQEKIKNNENSNNETNVEQVNNEVNNYISILKIPKIKLEKGLFPKESINNNVEKNIQILNESNMPDVENGNLILAGHNGNAKNSYFRNIHKLDINDKISIFYNGYEYIYEIINIYKVDKTGTVKIIRNNNKTTLTLITCSGNEKQLIIISELVNRK